MLGHIQVNRKEALRNRNSKMIIKYINSRFKFRISPHTLIINHINTLIQQAQKVNILFNMKNCHQCRNPPLNLKFKNIAIPLHTNRTNKELLKSSNLQLNLMIQKLIQAMFLMKEMHYFQTPNRPIIINIQSIRISTSLSIVKINKTSK